MIQKESIPLIVWPCRDRQLSLGRQTRIMGVLNVTPDSFSDGGRYVDSPAAIRHGLNMARAGADIIDIGGESTRPGAEPVPIEQELHRVIPVVTVLGQETDRLLSVDTRHSRVAEAALAAGAHIINDISALTHDPGMIRVAREQQPGIILMHMQGIPATMQQAPQYEDVTREVRDYLRSRLDSLVSAGVSPERLAIDPGFGFGKTVEHNLRLLVELDQLACPGHPMVIGVSRKSFLGRLTGKEVGDRLPASLAAMACAILRGAHIIRVHDVKESCDVAKVVDMLRNEDLIHVTIGSHGDSAPERNL